MLDVLEWFLGYGLAAAVMAAWMVLLFLVDGAQVKQAYRLLFTGLFSGKANCPRPSGSSWFRPSKKGWWLAKSVHFLTFLVLSFVVCHLLASVLGGPDAVAVVLGCVPVAAFGFLTEALQGAVGRGPCLEDVLVNVGAGVLGGMAAFLFLSSLAAAP